MSSRKNSKNKKILIQDSSDNDSKSFILFLFVSICFHILFFVSLIFFQDFNISKPLPPVIQIDLVSFSADPVLEDPGKAETEIKDEGIPVKAAPIKKKPKKIPTIKPDISLKTKPKNLKDLIAQQEKKKKEIKKPEVKRPVEKPKSKEEVKEETKPTKAPEDTAKELDKKLDKQTQDTIAQALSRLQDKVKEQGQTKESDESASNQGYGKKGYKPIDLYNLVIGSTIEQNWVFNDILAKLDQDLEVRILIKILKSGEIRDIIYETKSGNRYLDESAKKAVKKANPLPRLPAGLHSYDVGLIFTPKGLK